MSCFMTSATRRSRIVPAAVLIASAAASSHDVLLVPMISVTLYTLMTLSFDGLLPGRRGAQLVLIRLTRPGTGSDRQVRRWLPDLEPGTWPGRRPGGRPCRSVSMPYRNQPGIPGEDTRHSRSVVLPGGGARRLPVTGQCGE